MINSVFESSRIYFKKDANSSLNLFIALIASSLFLLALHLTSTPNALCDILITWHCFSITRYNIAIFMQYILLPSPKMGFFPSMIRYNGESDQSTPYNFAFDATPQMPFLLSNSAPMVPETCVAWPFSDQLAFCVSNPWFFIAEAFPSGISWKTSFRSSWYG